MVDQLHSQLRLQLQYEDVALRNHEAACQIVTQQPQLLQQFYLLLPHWLARQIQQSMNVILGDEWMSAALMHYFSDEHFFEGAVERDQSIDKFGKGNNPAPSHQNAERRAEAQHRSRQNFPEEEDQSEGYDEGEEGGEVREKEQGKSDGCCVIDEVQKRKQHVIDMLHLAHISIGMLIHFSNLINIPLLFLLLLPVVQLREDYHQKPASPNSRGEHRCGEAGEKMRKHQGLLWQIILHEILTRVVSLFEIGLLSLILKNKSEDGFGQQSQAQSTTVRAMLLKRKIGYCQ